MQIRKNTKAFKTILEIFLQCQSRADRDILVRLYITKAGAKLTERIGVEGIEGEAALFYEMTYQSIINNLNSSSHQLHMSDESPGLYFFHSTTNKSWDETPFEFDVEIKKYFSYLSDLPVVRKKEASQKFVLPQPTPEKKSKDNYAEKNNRQEKKIEKKLKAVSEPVAPRYYLHREIEFTDIERIVFPLARFNKQSVLDYYYALADVLLPHLAGRVIKKLDSNFKGEEVTVQVLGGPSKVPSWIKTKLLVDTEEQKKIVLCEDKEHLLFLVERGIVSVGMSHAQAKRIDMPDYGVITLRSPQGEFNTVAEASSIAKEVLDGLRLTSWVKTDGYGGLHIYLLLDAKENFFVAHRALEYIAGLIRLKAPSLIRPEGEELNFKQVSIRFDEHGVIAPYSLAGVQRPIVAIPLFWNEIQKDLEWEAFTPKFVEERIKRKDDPWSGMEKVKKINAGTLLDRLEENYKFLLKQER